MDLILDFCEKFWLKLDLPLLKILQIWIGSVFLFSNLLACSSPSLLKLLKEAATFELDLIQVRL